MTLLIRTVDEVDLAMVGALHHRSRTAAYTGLVSDAGLDAGSPDAMGEWWTERWRWERDTHRLAVAVNDAAVNDAAVNDAAINDAAINDAAGDAERVVGFSYAGPSETTGAVELYAIHVDPALLGTGIGRALMERALNDLAALAEPGIDRAVLWVLTGNARARRFYGRGGWAADGGTRESPIGAELVPQLRYSRSLR